MSSRTINLLCITPCSEKQYINIIMTFVKNVVNSGELFFVDSGNIDRKNFFANLKINKEIMLKIHYFHAPECSTPEEKVALLNQHARGDIWHFVMPDVLYPEKYFNNLSTQSSDKILGSTLKPVYIPTIDYLCCINSRTDHFSHLASLCFHRRHYETLGIWFNTQGDEASLGKPFIQLNKNKCPVTVIDNLEYATNTGLFYRSTELSRNDISVQIPSLNFQHKIDWSIFEKIVYIKKPDTPNEEELFSFNIDRLKIPKDKIINFNAIQTDIIGADHMLPHIAVLHMAREQKWKNVLIIEDNISFVQSIETDKQCNHFFLLLKNIKWDVAILSANYQKTSSLIENSCCLKIDAAQMMGAYAVNENYYETLIANYAQDFDKNAKNIIKNEYPIDIYWNKLMPQHRWLGIWPCAAFKKNNSNKPNQTIENNIYSFFHPLLSTLPEERNKLEKRLIAKFNNGTALTEDYHELSKLYRSHGMYEIADYFYHQYTGENEKIQQDTNWPLLSVIITTYNQVDVLMKTLGSVLRQRYPNIEVVVIDDASTDHTAARLAEIDDPRLTIIRNKTNQKGAGNLRSGLDLHTKGEYIFIIDHDDLLLDRYYLMDAVLLMEKDKSLAFVFARYLELHEAKNIISNAKYYATRNNVTNGKKYFLDIQKSGFPGIMFLTTVFRRSAAIKTKAIVYEGVSDFHLFSRLMLAGNVGFINRISSVYRIHEKSITFNMNAPTDIYIDELFICHLEETIELAHKNGLTRHQLDEWFTRVSSTYFCWWRLPNIIKNNSYELALTILGMLHKKHPKIGVKVLSILFKNKK